jgi:hypothetical protein
MVVSPIPENFRVDCPANFLNSSLNVVELMVSEPPINLNPMGKLKQLISGRFAGSKSFKVVDEHNS